MSCCYEDAQTATQSFDLVNIINEPFTGLALITTLFITGLSMSFTHCVGMCGPIAVGQMSMRLMNLPNDKLTEWNKFKSALVLPYYVGKAITYVILMSIVFSITKNLKDLPYIKWPTIIILTIVATLFVKAGISRTFKVFNLKLSWQQKIDKVFFAFNKTLALSPFGLKGLMMGMVLGLIPCSAVYGAITTVVSNAQHNYLLACVSMLSFGIATVPGLLITAYLGRTVIAMNVRWFDKLYSLMMFINAYFLISYAYRLYNLS